MTGLVTTAAWVLVAAFVLSCGYELYRATAKRGTSEHDSMSAFARNNIPFYVVAGAVIALLFAGVGWAPWLGLVFAAASIVASITYYNPKILMDRVPGVVDWFEDIVFTGLLFVAGALLLFHVTGSALVEAT